jgi:hypothetical protein
MNTTRTLALAAVAALSLGFGTAMAQEGPSFPDSYSPTMTPFGARQAPVASQPLSASTLQSGSSDVYRGNGTQTNRPEIMNGGNS